MNWDALGAIAELVGAIGVVASLFYVASQIRRNSSALEAATNQAVSDSTQQRLLAPAQSPLSPWRSQTLEATTTDSRLQNGFSSHSSAGRLSEESRTPSFNTARDYCPRALGVITKASSA
jgi:hypothetical protein